LGLFLFILPGCLWASYKSGKYRRSIAQRLGLLPPELLQQVKRGRWIWVHAVSVGETAAVAPLVRALKKRYPQHRVLLSTVTETGQEMAQKTLPEIDAHLYFPLDFSFAIRRVLDSITPEVFLLAETEIWPNFLRHLKQRRVPVLLVNGRLSLSSFKRYQLVRPLMARVLRDIQQFSMRTELDAERIIALGAPKELVRVNGNLKFDQQHSVLSAEERKKLRDELKIPPAAPL
jgi:3-deoxy-D-manno-octulosonic-acid transferase